MAKLLQKFLSPKELMNELALFAGAGGGLLASRLPGWNTVCAVEFSHKDCSLDPHIDYLLYGTIPDNLHVGDCLDWLKTKADNSVDLTIFSPPYEDSRTYGIDFNLKGQDWVDWLFEIYRECDRITKALVVCVVNGKTRKFRWTATPALLMADLHRAGIKLRNPPIFNRIGIPGSGGPDWWRGDYEFCVCSSKGKLPWSDNTANGHPPKYETGGACSNRTRGGIRVRGEKPENGALRREGPAKYAKPKSGLANAGNLIKATYTAAEVAEMLAEESDVRSGSVGKGHMGNNLAHENEAPFPEWLVEPFIKCFCPPGGIVCDPFCGSGTVPSVAQRLGRQFMGCDIRESQIELTLQRLESETDASKA